MNLYTSWENLVAEVTGLGWYTPAEVPAFSFYSEEEEKAIALGTATEIHIPYKYKEVDYLWDGDVYLRQSDGRPHVDAETGATLSAVNVIVQYAPAPVVSNEGHLDIDFFAGGSGLLFQKGQAREIRWQQRDAHAPLVYTYADSGEAVRLVPGKTFVNVVPDALTVTYPVAETEGKVTEMEEAAAKRLLAAALAARENAYAPYSRYRVGAAAQAADGRIFSGVNVENASYGLGLCAERAALSAAVAAGARQFTALAVVGGGAEPLVPCGACRQWLTEFSPDMWVVMGNLAGKFQIRRAGDLLPIAFSKDSLGREGKDGCF